MGERVDGELGRLEKGVVTFLKFGIWYNPSIWREQNA